MKLKKVVIDTVVMVDTMLLIAVSELVEMCDLFDSHCYWYVAFVSTPGCRRRQLNVALVSFVFFCVICIFS